MVQGTRRGTFGLPSTNTLSDTTRKYATERGAGVWQFMTVSETKDIHREELKGERGRGAEEHHAGKKRITK